jgi:hypothetical protein
LGQAINEIITLTAWVVHEPKTSSKPTTRTALAHRKHLDLGVTGSSLLIKDLFYISSHNTAIQAICVYRDGFLNVVVLSYAVQGCQMVYFQTKNPNLGKLWSVLQRKMLVMFTPIWSILLPFGIFQVILV